MPQGFTAPSARLASRLHAFATNRHEYAGEMHRGEQVLAKNLQGETRDVLGDATTSIGR